jgi:hypothetical protein
VEVLGLFKNRAPGDVQDEGYWKQIEGVMGRTSVESLERPKISTVRD